MKSSKLVFLLSLTASTILLSAEPSAFGAGDLTSKTPYGLTSNEKVILETEKKLKKVAQKSNYQENQLDSLRERIDGLQSIVESLSRKSHNNKVKIGQLVKENEQGYKTTTEYEQRLSLEVQENTKQIATLKRVIEELSKTLDDINLNYVTKKEFNGLVENINSMKNVMVKDIKGSSPFAKVKSATLYNKAKAYYNKKYYTKAIQAYEELIRRNYKPAYSHYMIGEMYYYRKNYAKAISYYKKSSTLYSKASYMPTLLLHTAISMKNTGDETHARKFFEVVVQKYPETKAAKIARKYL